MPLSIEANELLESFLWFNNPSSEEVSNNEQLMREVEEELADVLIYSMGLSHQLDIGLLEAVERKIEKNEERFDDARVAELADELDKWQ